MVFNCHENNEKLKILMDFWSENWQQQKKNSKNILKSTNPHKMCKLFFWFPKVHN